MNIGDGSFPKFYDWIVGAISDAQQEGHDITIEEIELSRSPIYKILLSMGCGPMVVT